jgi:DNA-3-methyladenine glycosylase II
VSAAPAAGLTPRGPFSLAAATSFAEGFPGTEAAGPSAGAGSAGAGSAGAGSAGADGELRFSWAVDGDWRTVTATVAQPGAAVTAAFAGPPPPELAARARRDLERILSLDVDGSGFAAVGERDPVVARLQRRFPGLRPVLFYTPYEAAAWAVIGQRIRMNQAAVVKQRLARDLGRDGAFPAPDRLLELRPPQAGLTERKVGQLHAVAAAARAGALDRDHLRALDPAGALSELTRIDGIGPFSAELILIRGVGHPDLMPRHERRLDGAIRAVYGLSAGDDTDAVTDRWRPYRTWVGLLLRAWRESVTGEIAKGRRADELPPLT